MAYSTDINREILSFERLWHLQIAHQQIKTEFILSKTANQLVIPTLALGAHVSPNTV